MCVCVIFVCLFVCFLHCCMPDTPSLDDEMGKLGSKFTQHLFFSLFLLYLFFVSFLDSVYIYIYKNINIHLDIDTIWFNNNGGNKYIIIIYHSQL